MHHLRVLCGGSGGSDGSNGQPGADGEGGNEGGDGGVGSGFDIATIPTTNFVLRYASTIQTSPLRVTPSGTAKNLSL